MGVGCPFFSIFAETMLGLAVLSAAMLWRFDWWACAHASIGKGLYSVEFGNW